ncbi:MAG: extracellular solute-binding protein family 1 [Hyphomicrobiales bacterium]|nr:extracellular solute-binding protein family 1 [Hyphomicrobiales bacterium]
MTTNFSRRSVLKLGGGLLAASALLPQHAFAQAKAINYWHTFTSQSEQAGLDAVLALFKAAHPDIAVTPENIPNPEFMAKVTAAVVSGSRPSVTMVASERFKDLLAMGALIDMTDRVAKWERRKDFDDKRFESISADGKVYGVPSFAFVDWMYYRKDWFDEAGIAVPTTLAEMRDAAVKLTNPSKGRYGYGLRGGPGGQNIIINIMEAFGSPVLHADGKIGLDREKAIQAIDFYAGLLTKDHAVPPSAANDGYRQIVEGFQTGQTAMIYHHTGSYQDIASKLKPGVEFGTMAIPAGPATRVARLAYAYNTITKQEDADTAWQWIKFWGEPDAAVAFLEKTGYFPASTVAAQDKRIVGNPMYKAAADTLGFGIPQPSFPGAAGWAESSVLPNFQRVLIGQATPEQAVDEMITALAEATN